MFGAGVDEVHESGAAVELGEENGGVCLGFRALNPLQARPDAAIFAAALSEYSASITAHPHFRFLLLQNGEMGFSGYLERESWEF